jgi:hypothetical protein
MDYLGCLADPFSSVELAWDQHILDECMLHVQKIQEKKAKLQASGVVGGDFWISGPLPFLGVCCFSMFLSLLFPDFHMLPFKFPFFCVFFLPMCLNNVLRVDCVYGSLGISSK